MLEKTFKALEHTFTVLKKEMSEVFKKNPFMKGKGKIIKIRIKKGSTVIINGASTRLLNDAYVTTKDPETLMGTKNSDG